jgi:hypothetical protein
MTCICIGPVCIPIQAFVPFFYVFWAPLLKWLKSMFPSFFPKKEKKEKEKEKEKETEAVAEKRDKRSKDTPDDVIKRPTASVQVLEDDEDWDAIVARSEKEDRLIVVKFTASWCVPCQVRQCSGQYFGWTDPLLDAPTLVSFFSPWRSCRSGDRSEVR